MTTKVDELLEELSSLSIVESLELVKKMEARWGVSSLIRMSKLFTLPTEPEKPPQTEFDVVIADCGPRKIEVIRTIRSLTILGLKEAKDAAETPGYVLFREANYELAHESKRLLEDAGATIRLV